MKRTHVWLVAGLCLISGGATLGYGAFAQTWRSKHVPHVSASPFVGTVATVTPPQPPKVVEGKPVRIAIPALRIDLPVIDGYYNKKSQTWTLSNDKVQYAVVTPLANNAAGNTFLYGHNKPGVFNTLNRLQINDQVVITTDNGYRFTYSFRGALETIPSDDSLFRYQGKPILTIQTCSGVWYQNRQLFTFDLEHAE